MEVDPLIVAEDLARQADGKELDHTQSLQAFALLSIARDLRSLTETIEALTKPYDTSNARELNIVSRERYP